MTIHSITTTHIGNSNNRIEATYGDKSLTLSFDRKRSAEKNHRNAAALLKKRMGLSGELHGSALSSSGEQIWLVLPEWFPDFARYSESLGSSAFEALSILESQCEAQGRRLSA
jgi:hypothetical protein